MVHVAAGSNHTICTTVTADGSVFTWGRAGDGDDESSDSVFEGGQLGLGDDQSDRLMPTQVRGELQNKAAVQVAAGNNYLACVAEDGSVCTWGHNSDGQLGVAGVDDAFLPVLVQELDIDATA